MNQTSSLISVEFLSWIRDKLKEEADRNQQRTDKRKAARIRHARNVAVMGLTLMATMASSIF